MSCSACRCSPCSCSDTCDPANEPLASALDNFITEFFGTLTKSCVDGKVIWVLPCDLSVGTTDFPRIAGEGLACYFQRIIGSLGSFSKVKVTDADTTPGNLSDKICAGSGISLTVTSPSGDECLQINNTGVVTEVDPVFNASEAKLFVAGDKALLDSALQPDPSVAIAASNIDWDLGEVFRKTLGANTTFTFSNQSDGKTIVVAITNTAGNFTVTWPAGIRWVNATAPVQTIGAKTDVYTFIDVNAVIYGAVTANMS